MAVVIALLAASQLPTNPVHEDNLRQAYVQITGDTSYPTGGSSLATPAVAVGINQVVWCEPQISTDGTVLTVWDATNQKLKTFTAVGTETTNTTNQSTKTFNAVIWGY